ncbi:hypothetical protein [Vibrio atypicus]|jgi:hypothetical protein|uniref:hypothetical protein n=1 Tax=Vibrio atypicus TaxID=558271 RepID=UPI00135C1803|nr:hypothetical protein [Vibrio atypicus]
MDRHELAKWCYKAAREAVRESDALAITTVIAMSDNPYRVFKAVSIAEDEAYKAPLRFRLNLWKRERRLVNSKVRA